MPGISRRDFLQTTAIAAAVSVAGSTVPLVAAGKKIPIGVQLYSIRESIPKDIPGSLAAIRKMGYDAVEFAGYYGKDAKTLRQLLDDHGLKACGSHIALNNMLGEKLPETIEFNQTIGNHFLVVPSLMGVRTIDDWRRTADQFNEIAEKLKPHNMHVGYHNHTAEFKPVNGQLPMDVFFDNTKPQVFMQLDVGHCVHGGADPVAYLKKYAGRALTVHIKEWSSTKRDAVVGEGDVKWPAVLRACETVGGTQWYIIEEESNAFEGVEGIEKSLRGLEKQLS